MYIGTYVQTSVASAWTKHTAQPVALWTGTTNNRLLPLLDENNQQRVGFAMNILGTFGYKYDTVRYVMVTQIGDTYWIVGAEC